jgi:methylmalonyl-CoA/ethylmalonyl-CoA epimerase
MPAIEREPARVRPPRLHHVGVVVPSQAQAHELMQMLGLVEDGRGYVERYQALCIFTAGNGGSPLELVVPSGGRLREFNRGLGGLHHVAIAVDSLARLGRALAERGTPLLEPEPVRGARSFLCNFLSPVYTRGVIVEFVQELEQDQAPVADERQAQVAQEDRAPAAEQDQALVAHRHRPADLERYAHRAAGPPCH